MARTRVQWLVELCKFMDTLPDRPVRYNSFDIDTCRYIYDDGERQIKEEFSIYTQYSPEEKIVLGGNGKFFKAPTANQAYADCVEFWTCYYDTTKEVKGIDR